jgi:hypothetical protein
MWYHGVPIAGLSGDRHRSGRDLRKLDRELRKSDWDLC